MLKRITKIKNIGKFYDWHLGGLEFKDKTVIFGKNGDGKSTLTAILRSLTTGNNDILIGRKSFGSLGAMNIEIGFEDNTGKNIVYKFENDSWNSIHPNIAIFDTYFIANNIYDGERIIDKHRANLHQYIIGEKGKLLSDQINKIIEDIKEKSGVKKEKIADYKKSGFNKYYPIDDFIGLAKIHDVDKRIEKLRKELRFNTQLNKPKELAFQGPDFGKLKNILSKSFSTIHDEAQEEIKKHIECNWRDKTHTMRFLQDGISLIREPKNSANCPFCGQNLQQVLNLIELYETYFDDAYEKLQVELEKTIKQFYEWNIENQLTNLISEAKDWIVYFDELKVFDNLKNIIEKSKKNLLSSKKIFDDECNRKKANSNYKIKFPHLEQIKKLWKLVAGEVKIFNDSIKEFCDGFESKNRDELKSDLSKLGATKDRQGKDWTEFCEEYQTLVEALEKLKQKRDAKIDELTNYSADIFNKHEENINSTLEDIRADFKIDNFKGTDDRRRTDAVSCGFDIKFFGKHSVPIEGQEDTPHFNNTLSQGDRGSLAFAFFLSLLFHDDNLDNKIIVFDDPVSSFDAERKRKTVQMLANAESASSKKPLQMIILTHERNFFSRLVVEQKFASAITYILEPDGMINGQKKCTMRHCDVNEEFLKKETYKYLEKIKSAAGGNSVISDDTLLKCRKVMEAVFKAKYYLELKGDIGQNRGLRKFVETLTGLGIYPYDKKSEFTELFNDLNVPHHDRNIPEGIGGNSQGDLRSILLDTLRLLREI